jgi:hypothetical protein
MAERKSALKRAPQRRELERLLERAKTVIVSDEQLLEQRISFVYGMHHTILASPRSRRGLRRRGFG